ncbi:hypothetical protein F7731_09350 [Cytobacillus depressus]|uniref:Uncharacterized protein n=1 Tax=Cytobacillus depressus TaxID=1602942 RepID=A0A6L3V5X0_9BACI|nr:hypothetical protein [Cytobacillus depressus]KAB2336568.1 hypothetical protein F7731_09350 [Cytobacillus depressus]
MDYRTLNEHLKNVKNEEQLHFLLIKTKKTKLTGIFHGISVDTLSIIDGYAHYTYDKSNIRGICKLEKLHQYVTFKPLLNE